MKVAGSISILALSLSVIFVSTSFSASPETMLIGKWNDKEGKTIEFVKDGILIINNQGARYRIIDKERIEFDMGMLTLFPRWGPRPILKFTVSADELTLTPLGKPNKTEKLGRAELDALAKDYFSQIKSFFENYEKVIAGLSYALVIIGLFLTWFQIRGVKKQAKANTTYQILKDGRTLFVSIDEDSFNYITSSEKEKYIDETQRKAERKIHEILMYYGSIYDQYNFGYVGRQFFRKVFLKELRNFLAYGRVKEYWDKTILPSEMWDKGFKQMVNQLLN